MFASRDAHRVLDLGVEARKLPAMTDTSASYTPPEFLIDLLNARSPSGHEFEAQAVVDRYVREVVDSFEKDTMGNRFATVNPGGDPSLMFLGHMDELGFLVNHVDDNGFVYFLTIGGHDTTIISGRRVRILTKNGVVKGVTGKRAIHLMNPEDRKKVPQIHDIWIDIGAKTRDEVLERISIGDVAVYDHTFELIHGTVATARAFDNKQGAYMVLEALRRLAAANDLKAKVTSVATVQEEIGVRGAEVASYTVNPDFAVAVDVGHATDHPDCDQRRFGRNKLGEGPLICKGPNINPIVFDRLVSCAKDAGIPYQIESYERPTPTDARAAQVSRSGVATGLLSIPLRYMHTPSELVDLQDVEYGVQLLVAFAKSLKKGERGNW